MLPKPPSAADGAATRSGGKRSPPRGRASSPISHLPSTLGFFKTWGVNTPILKGTGISSRHRAKGAAEPTRPFNVGSAVGRASVVPFPVSAVPARVSRDGRGLRRARHRGLLRWTAPETPYLLVGGTLYLVGGLLVTLAFNVPRNDALDAAAPDDPASVDLWRPYLSAWTAWNHGRALACLAAAGGLALAV